MKSFLRLSALGLLLLAPAARAATVQVTVQDFDFDPSVVNIQVGDTVIWTNVSGFHNVESEDGTTFSNALASAPWTFSHTFTAAGTFPYVCVVHASFMTGTINVASTGLPTVPANLQAHAHSTTDIMLTWTDSSGETGYLVERRTLAGTFQQVATAGQNETGLVLGGHTQATGYVFRIRATNGAGNSAYSNEAKAATDAPIAPCVPSSTTLCVNDSRFQVRIAWLTAAQNGAGTAVPVESAPDSGLFYFFGPTNIEMLVKVLDACVPALGNKYWVFYAATTNVEITMTVTDTQTGKVQVYFNPLGTAALPVQDTKAFDTCP